MIEQYAELGVPEDLALRVYTSRRPAGTSRTGTSTTRRWSETAGPRSSSFPTTSTARRCSGGATLESMTEAEALV